ncbi:unnamed protein product [Adineta steineri]|uniref:Kazal-like domain-containing protein n=1 Tax=Adineta steineri TaxID=433720 RepID=A0A813PWP9_9BILA|nr:unnamed protein product [Adineta steineri]CAF3531993.1 unnamed protein product [Adineta steineri]
MTPNIIVNPTEKSLINDYEHSKYKRYGWRNFRLDGILSQPLFAYIILCICNFVQNFSVNGANNAVISTLERVFFLNSVQSGLFLSLHDVATIFSSPFVGYLGSRYSSPIFFSLNMIIVGFGNMVIASSNFVYRDSSMNFNSDLPQILSTYTNVLFQCYKDPFNQLNITDTSCLKDNVLGNAAKNAKLVLYLGSFISGIGGVALPIVGVAYIERIFPREKATYCQGIYFAVGTVGGALGIVATGRFLSIYTKLTSRRRLPSWLTPSNPLWVGCWWLPYYIYGGLCILLGLFISGLPNYEKPGTKHLTSTSTENNLNASSLSISRQDSQTTISILSSRPPTPAVFTRGSESVTNLKNSSENTLPPLEPPFTEYRLSHRKLSPLQQKSLTVNEKTEGVINHAYSTESMPNQLPTTAPTSNVIPTLEALPKTVSENLREMCAVIRELLKNTRYIFITIAFLSEGILISGFVPFITKYFQYQHQLDTSTATLLTGAIALLSIIFGCPIGAYCINKFSWTPMKCARVCSIVFTGSAFLFLFLTMTCPELKFEYTACSNENTACCHNVYQPVCLASNPKEMFLSPCHFGCTNETVASNGNTYYSTCNCAADDFVTVTESACRFRRIPCPTIFALAMSGATLVVFLTAFIQVPMLQVLLYSVPLPYHSMALGLRQTIVRVFGQTTGPLLFGFVFDESCLVWLVDCYKRRTCTVYDNRRMGISMALSGFSARLISGICCIIVFTNWRLKHSNEIVRPPNSTRVDPMTPINRNEDSEKE